jgi:L-threonylcarbamoyladenylate synthase
VKVDLKEALSLLLRGEVVAIPTETVYGLGAWINSDQGLRKIFSTKERPFFDPLIVHVDSLENARQLSSEWTQAHEILARECWPGPLTLITKKSDKVNPLITSGLDSVGIRCPDHPLTLELLRSIEGGIAAPSANKFGKTSPTSSVHVEDEFENKVAVVEGGPSQIGIESTVAGIINQDGVYLVEIYRPGHYTSKMLQSILERNGLTATVTYSESPVAPGQLKHHYMPRIPLIITPVEFLWEDGQAELEKLLKKKVNNPVFWRQNPDPRIASRELYEKMRTFDRTGHDVIIVSRLPHEQGEEWMGIWNRLEKAKSFKL